MAFTRCLVFLLPILLALSGGAMAQPASQQTADANAPTDSHVAAALDLLNATHADAILKAMLDAVIPQETRAIKLAAPSLTDETVALIEKKLGDAVIARQDELMHIQAIEYCRYFDEQELHQLAAFYRSNLGQKYIADTPGIIREVSPLVQEWLKGVVAQAQQDILQSLPKTPNDKS